MKHADVLPVVGALEQVLVLGTDVELGLGLHRQRPPLRADLLVDPHVSVRGGHHVSLRISSRNHVIVSLGHLALPHVSVELERLRLLLLIGGEYRSSVHNRCCLRHRKSRTLVDLRNWPAGLGSRSLLLRNLSIVSIAVSLQLVPLLHSQLAHLTRDQLHDLGALQVRI